MKLLQTIFRGNKTLTYGMMYLNLYHLFSLIISRILHVFAEHRRRSVMLAGIGRRYFNTATEEYSKRNYAVNEFEYTTVLTSLHAQRRSI